MSMNNSLHALNQVTIRLMVFALHRKNSPTHLFQMQRNDLCVQRTNSTVDISHIKIVLKSHTQLPKRLF